MLQDKVRDYLEKSGIPKTTLCKRLDISVTHLHKWLSGERNISDKLSADIQSYLDKYYVA